MDEVNKYGLNCLNNLLDLAEEKGVCQAKVFKEYNNNIKKHKEKYGSLKPLLFEDLNKYLLAYKGRYSYSYNLTRIYIMDQTKKK